MMLAGAIGCRLAADVIAGADVSLLPLTSSQLI